MTSEVGDRPGVGGGTPLFGLDGYVPLNRLWFSGYCILNRVYNSPFSALNMVSLWTGGLEPYMWVPTIFLTSNSVMSFTKKILSLWEMKNKAD